MNLGNTIKEGNDASLQDCTRALIFLRHHIDEGLKGEYLTVKDSFILWNNLREQHDHQKTIILPKAHYDWMYLRLQDFKSVSDYNSALFKISSQLKLCGKKSHLRRYASKNIHDFSCLECTATVSRTSFH